MFSAVFGASQWIQRSDVALGYVTHLVRPHVANLGGGEARLTFSTKIVRYIEAVFFLPNALSKRSYK